MNEETLRRLQQLAGKSGAELAHHAGVSEQYPNEVKHGQKLLSYKTSAKLADPLGVEANTLFAMHNMTAVKNRFEAGTITAHKALQDLAHVLKFVSASPDISPDAEQAILDEARKLADRLISAKSKSAGEVRGRDTLGLKSREPNDPTIKSGGVRSSFANDFPAASPSVYEGGSRPESGSVDPSVRGFVDAVADLEERLANPDDITVTEDPASITGAVAQILADYSEVDLNGDQDARDALRRLQALAKQAAGQIASTKSTGSGRDAFGRATAKRYSA